MEMWPGPYGTGGSRKHIVASVDQSLIRLGVEYVDIVYSHRSDPRVPLAETMEALASLVRWGKARAVGISNYTPQQTAESAEILRHLGVPLAVHQTHYSMLFRQPESGAPSLLDVLEREGIAGVAYSPLEQGLLSARYLDGIPAGSRAGRNLAGWYFVKPGDITDDYRRRAFALNVIARQRGQDLAGLALVWVLRQPVIVSAVVGATSLAQFVHNLEAATAPALTAEEIAAIEGVLRGPSSS